MTPAERATGASGRRLGREALRVEGLHKSFGDLEVLKGIDLVVAEHEVVCLIGASGSGKSTLLRCVNLLEPIEAGRVVVEGEEITARGVELDLVRRRIGIVFQAYNLFPHMSVLENCIEAPVHVKGVKKNEAIERAEQYLDKVQMLEKRDETRDRGSVGHGGGPDQDFRGHDGAVVGRLRRRIALAKSAASSTPRPSAMNGSVIAKKDITAA